MKDRNFKKWLETFKDTIVGFNYFTDFNKVYNNVEDIKVELNILNSLIGSKNIVAEFEALVRRYPEVLKCIPILLAVHLEKTKEIKVLVNEDVKIFTFCRDSHLPIEEYTSFMRETGLFDLLENHLVNNLVDYVTGVETGLDSNARKNRGGKAMENIVESFTQKEGFVEGVNYFRQKCNSEVSRMYNIDLSSVTNKGKSEKKWDFVVKTESCIYLIEVNFYATGGSKLNETARSYKTITTEMKDVKGAKFVWITDGKGWESAKNNLEETFDVLEDLYNINDLQNGELKRVFL